jgi:two-component system, OmpR family, sensor histidine kinase BaeS
MGYETTTQHSALKGSVGSQLALLVLVTILLSWMISGAVSYLLVRHDIHVWRQEMEARPDLYPTLMPEPPFSWVELLLGPQTAVPRRLFMGPMQGAGRNQQPSPSPGIYVPQPGSSGPVIIVPEDMHPPDMGFRRGNPSFNNIGRFPWWWTVTIRLTIALLLAALSGFILSRRFTRPLKELADGAREYQGGTFSHRIPYEGDNEFTEVAVSMNAMAERVSQQLASLEEDAVRRQHLLADVAHELRGPVMTLRTMAGALQDHTAGDAERRDRAVASLVRVSDRMQHLVTDLMELARLDLRELPVHLQTVDVRDLADTCVGQHTAAAECAGLTLHSVEPGPPLPIAADPDRLAQVLDNLLDNAISHAGNGAEISVTLTRVTGEHPAVRLTVSDTGQGIAPQHLPFIFDAFYRADAARTPGNAHSGLGLRIARGLMEAMGGTLTLESAEGQGTQVTLELPVNAG